MEPEFNVVKSCSVTQAVLNVKLKVNIAFSCVNVRHIFIRKSCSSFGAHLHPTYVNTSVYINIIIESPLNTIAVYGAIYTKCCI